MIWRRLFGNSGAPVEPEPSGSHEEPVPELAEAAIWEMLQGNGVCEKAHEVTGKPIDLGADAPDPWTGSR